MRRLAFLLILLLSGPTYAAPAHHCANDATERAKKLLTLHFGVDDRIAIEPAVTLLKPLRNPINKKQWFDVLEVWGNIYKGRYRMHFIYAREPSECVLMGQEILEYANL